jgi:hypothetical protein
MFMTYRQALKRTALFIPVSLFDRGLWRALGEHAGELAIVLAAFVGRLVALALYPIAVPALAALVVASERRDQRERERFVRDLNEHHGKLYGKHTTPP